MPVGETMADAVVVGDEGGAVGHIGFLVGGFGDVHDGTIIKVVGAQLHLFVQEVPVAVDTAHPRSGDAVGAAPAAHASAHSAATAPQGVHHGAAEVVEYPVIGVVRIGDDAQLAALGKTAGHQGALPAPVVDPGLRGRKVVAAAGHRAAEHAVHHALLDTEVDDRLFFPVIDAGEFGLLGLFLHHLHLLHQFGGDVLGGQLGVVQEEGLSVDGYLGDGLTVGSDGSVFGHLDPRKLLQKVYQHVVVGNLERGGVVLHRILLDDHGIAHIGHPGGVQHFLVQVHFQGTQVHVPGHGHGLLQRFVAHQLRLEGVIPGFHFLNHRLAFLVGQGIFDGVSAFGMEGDRGEAHRLIIRSIQKADRHGMVVLRRQGKGAEKGRKKEEEFLAHKTYGFNTLLILLSINF